MVRELVSFPISEVLRADPKIAHSNVRVFYDKDFGTDLISFLSQGKIMNKMQIRLYIMLRGVDNYDDDLYGKYEFSEKSKNITAVKFKKGDNWRILCKEFFHSSGKSIVLIKLLKKPSQEITKKMKKIIEPIGDFNYGF